MTALNWTQDLCGSRIAREDDVISIYHIADPSVMMFVELLESGISAGHLYVYLFGLAMDTHPVTNRETILQRYQDFKSQHNLFGHIFSG